MPTRKQRKRTQKGRRHEYETVWVDSEGNELEEPPDDVQTPTREKRPSGKSTPQTRPQQRGRASGKVPPPPSWRRAIRRSLIFGGVVLAFFGLTTHSLVSGILLGVLYTALFIPFNFYLDGWAYRRWQKSQVAKKG
jgi:hypothetical protein